MIKKEGSKLIADIKPGGRGERRFQKTFKTKVDGEQWVRWMSAKVQESPEWEPARRDRRRLSELVGRWFEVRGVALQDGEARKGRLAVYAKEIGDPRAADLKSIRGQTTFSQSKGIGA